MNEGCAKRVGGVLREWGVLKVGYAERVMGVLRVRVC